MELLGEIAYKAICLYFLILGILGVYYRVGTVFISIPAMIRYVKKRSQNVKE